MKKVIAKIGHFLAKTWKWYKGLYKGRAWYTKLAVAFCTMIITFILYLVAVDVNFLWLFGKSPSVSDVKDAHAVTNI